MYQEARRLMWTKFEIIAYGPNRARLAEAADAAFEEIDRLDRQMSNYSETSELTHINRNAARKEVIVEKELFLPANNNGRFRCGYRENSEGQQQRAEESRVHGWHTC